MHKLVSKLIVLLLIISIFYFDNIICFAADEDFPTVQLTETCKPNH